jgi:pimeloyl-ACP methyl ester carboxylesterase
MNPFYFGSSREPLYGIYNPPRARSGDPVGAVLCYPMGSEYMRSHRAFRQLTNLLTRAGVHVLRFDYFGTGDSAGDEEQSSVQRWLIDVEHAIDELKDTAGLKNVRLVGLRFGGTLACLVASRRQDVERAVLWDPVVRGENYLQELLTYAEIPALAHGRPATWPSGTVGVGGFPLTDALRAEIAAIDLAKLTERPAGRVDLIASAERAEDISCHETWRNAGLNVRYRCIPSEGNWAEGDEFGSALIPQEIIQGVVQSITEEV